MTLLFPALAGASAAAGVVLLARELTRKGPSPGKPPARRVLPGRFTPAAARRLVAATAAGMALLLVTGWPVAGIAGAAAVVFVPKLGIGKAQRRQIAVLEGLDQWIRSVSDLLTAGLGVEDALRSSATHAPAAVAEPVRDLCRRLAGRAGAEAALMAFATQIADPAADRIAAALITATSARGGKVRDVLNALADLMARDVDDRRRTDAERAEHRTSLRWMTGVIVAFTGAILIFDRSYSAPYGSVTGQIVLTAILALGAAAIVWLHRLGSAPAPGRFLTSSGGPAKPGPGAPPRRTR